MDILNLTLLHKRRVNQVYQTIKKYGRAITGFTEFQLYSEYLCSSAFLPWMISSADAVKVDEPLQNCMYLAASKLMQMVFSYKLN